ncbi:MAG: hypothetical protein ACOZNI_09785 [Myxococcota bacterium]
MTFHPAFLACDAPVQRCLLDADKVDLRWSGCDDHNPTRHYRARIQRTPGRTRVAVYLTWRRSRKAAPVPLGVFVLHLGPLLDGGYVREEGGGRVVGVRIVHER